MALNRLRGADWIAVLGALALVISVVVLLNWYGVVGVESRSVDPSTVTPGLTPQGDIIGENPTTGEAIQITVGPDEVGAWDGQEFLGTVANVIMLAAAAAALFIGLLLARGREVSPQLQRIGLLLGIAAVIAVALRMIFPVSSDADLKVGIFIALAGAAAIAVGRYLARGGAAPPRRQEPPALAGEGPGVPGGGSP
jgi:hypothetical protein